MKRIIIIFSFMLLYLTSNATISWMGNESKSAQPSDSQTIRFYVEMFDDYVGCHAEVCIYDGSSWICHNMTYSGANGSNSTWTVEFVVPSTSVQYYYHGWDDWGTDVYDNNGGANYPILINPTTKNTGDWNNGSDWWDGSVPVSPSATFVIANDFNLNQDATVGSIIINNSITLTSESGQARNLYVSNAGTFINNGTFSGNDGKVTFLGSGTVSGTVTFNDVDLFGSVDFGSGSIIDGTLNILSGGAVNTNSPVYSSNSVLQYNSGGTYNRSSEWTENVSSGAGYPASIVIAGNTSFNTNALTDIFCRALQIENGSTLTMTSTTVKSIIVDGDLTINGTYNFSEETGGDLKLTGNMTKGVSGTIDWGGDGGSDKGRAVFFNGAGNQYITNITSIPYIIIENSAHVYLNNDLTIDGDGTNFLSIYESGIFDLNGYTLESLASGRIEVDGTSGGTEKLITGGLGSRLVFTGSGNGTIFQQNNGTLKIDENVTIAVESGTLDFGIDASLNPITDLYGVLEIRGAASIASSHFPAYHTGSTLKYVNLVNVTTSAEWPNTDGPSNLWIACNTSADVTLNENKVIGSAGTLIIQSGTLVLDVHSLTYLTGSTLDYQVGTGNDYIINDTKAEEWQESASVPDNVAITSGNIYISATRMVTHDLEITNTGKLYISELVGQLTVEDVNVNSGGELILKSPANNGVAGSFISTGTVINNGTMQAERYISGGKYTYVSSPNAVTNSQMFTNNSNGYFNPNFYSYNEGYNADPNPDNELYTEWGENNFGNAWLEAHDDDYNSSGIILDVPGRGYAYYNDINKMFVFDGTFTTGDKDITITYEDNDVNNGYFDGWNLIANPFPSALDWDDFSWDKTNVDAAIYYWDGTSSNEGNYKYYVSSGDYTDGTDVVNGGSQMIPASQAFFVKAKDTDVIGNNSSDSYTFTIPNDARVHSTQSFRNKNTSKAKNGISQFIRLKATANNAVDETVVRYITEGTINYDGQYDACKMYSSSVNTPQIYSYNDEFGAGFAINSLPINSMQVPTPVGIEIGKTGESNCTIELSEYNIDNQHIYFEDTQEGIYQNLVTNPEYSYTIADKSDVRGRFFISYEMNIAPVLTGSLSDYSVDYGNEAIYVVNSDIFSDTNQGDKLIFSASLTNDEALPEWLNFDNTTVTLYGIPEQAENLTIKLLATDVFGEIVSDEFELTVNAVLPVTQTLEAENVTSLSATIGSLLNSNGGDEISLSGICWNKTGLPTVEDNYVLETYFENQFYSEISEFEPNTSYFARSYAENYAGISYGNEITFLTSATDIIPLNDDIIKIYPNPVINHLYISSTKKDIINIELTSIHGKLLTRKICSGKQDNILNVSDLVSGIYFVKVKTAKSYFIKKIIVN